LSWMAPEVFCRTERPKRSADIFSLGMLLHFVATRTHPRNRMSRSLIEHALRSGRPVSLEWPPDSIFQPFCKTLAESCLQLCEHSRPSAREVHAAVSSWPRADQHSLQVHDDAIASHQLCMKTWREGFDNLRTNALAKVDRPPVGIEKASEPVPEQPVGAVQRLPNLRNCEVSDGHCCKFHKRIDSLLKTCLTLADLACGSEEFAQEGSQQCAFCALLADSLEFSNVSRDGDCCKSEADKEMQQK